MKVHSVRSTHVDGHEAVDIGLNFRLPPGLPTARILEFVNRTAGSGSCTVVDRSEAVHVDTRNEVVRALCAGIREQGQRPTLLRKLGTSDLNLSVPQWRCPAAAYGPGDSHLDHTDRESIAIPDFRRGIDVLRVAFSRLASSSSVGTSATAVAAR
jgi:LysW-gamma-L-lysine carboxypeptidase